MPRMLSLYSLGGNLPSSSFFNVHAQNYETIFVDFSAGPNVRSPGGLSWRQSRREGEAGENSLAPALIEAPEP